MIRLLLAVFVMALSAAAFAQSQAPALKPGDTFTFKRTDLYENGNATPNKPPWLFRQVVTAVGDGRIAYDQFYGKKPGPDRVVMTNDHNVISLGARTFDPFYPEFSFPLTPGKIWKSVIKMPPGSNGATVIERMDHEVVSTEEVTVPAGKFVAIRVNITGWYNSTNGTGGQGSGRFEKSIWYAPELGWIVRRMSKMNDWNARTFYEHETVLLSTSINSQVGDTAPAK